MTMVKGLQVRRQRTIIIMVNYIYIYLVRVTILTMLTEDISFDILSNMRKLIFNSNL